MSNNGTPLWKMLFILFLALRLCGVIAWSWWWVFAPVWGWTVLKILDAIVGGNVTVVEDEKEE